jgi:3-oxoacyl-[acyl-carrier protein] reductase
MEIGRSATPRSAALVALVAGPEAAYITGASLTVDGGTNA